MHAQDRESKGPDSVPYEREDEVRRAIHRSLRYDWV